MQTTAYATRQCCILGLITIILCSPSCCNPLSQSHCHSCHNMVSVLDDSGQPTMSEHRVTLDTDETLVNVQKGALLWKAGLVDRPQALPMEEKQKATNMLHVLHDYDKRRAAKRSVTNHNPPVVVSEVFNVATAFTATEHNTSALNEDTVLARFHIHQLLTLYDKVVLHLFLSSNTTTHTITSRDTIIFTVRNPRHNRTIGHPGLPDQGARMLSIDISSWLESNQLTGGTLELQISTVSSVLSNWWSTAPNETATLHFIQHQRQTEQPAVMPESQRTIRHTATDLDLNEIAASEPPVPDNDLDVNEATTDCSHSDQCCLRKIVIDFKAFGWDDWIIAPKRYVAGYCTGECKLGSFTELNSHVLHRYAMFQEARGESFDSRMIPCCRPTRMSPLMIVYVNKNTTTNETEIVRTQLPNMIVDQCGC